MILKTINEFMSVNLQEKNKSANLEQVYLQSELTFKFQYVKTIPDF